MKVAIRTKENAILTDTQVRRSPDACAHSSLQPVREAFGHSGRPRRCTKALGLGPSHLSLFGTPQNELARPVA